MDPKGERFQPRSRHPDSALEYEILRTEPLELRDRPSRDHRRGGALALRTHRRTRSGREPDALWLMLLCRITHDFVARGNLVPPKPIRELRDLTRYRSDLRLRDTIKYLR